MKENNIQIFRTKQVSNKKQTSYQQRSQHADKNADNKMKVSLNLSTFFPVIGIILKECSRTSFRTKSIVFVDVDTI